MKQFWVEPTLWAFLAQALIFVAYIPLSYIGYRWVRAPLKRNRVKQSLMQLGIVQTEELEHMMAGGYQLKHYFWPLLSTCFTTIVYYTMTHPYIIQAGLWSGVLEETINIFNGDGLFPRVILSGRFLFWGFIGAWVYSLHLTVRRFLAYDLTPSVYVFTGNRFALAMVVGSIVGLWVGTVSTTAGASFDVNLATVAVITFFIGFFPEQGVNWVTVTAQKALKQQGGISKETHLSEIEGLSIWHQGRLKQEGIDNVQNLATADVPTLIIDTAFTVNQIIDWIDQAILLVHTGNGQFEKLERVGIIRASDMLTATSDGKLVQSLSGITGLDKDELKVLRLTLLSAINMKVVAHFRWQSSLDKTKVTEAALIRPAQPPPAPTAAPREQESLRLGLKA